MDDSRIIELFWNREESAIAETANAYGRYCRKIAYNILGNEEDTEECLNDTWLGAWNSIPPAKPSCLSAFLGKITRNLAISRYRAGHALKRTGDRLSESLEELGELAPGTSNNVEESVDRDVLESAINRYLDSVSEKQRKIFVRRYFYMDSVSEIAQMYELGQSDVKVTLLRMRRSLKKVLEDEGLMI
ncbi:MAG: sigma-70 family RNA polymerase sigma factor [Eubacteriales bacterium]|nr:sigma-70 family RNA polymerase sigma factor [Eubacteriales bacterium]